MSKSNSGSGSGALILIGIVLIGIILYYSIVIAALVVPIIMIIYYVYASIQNQVRTADLTGSINDYWLNKEEQLEYKNIYEERRYVASLIRNAKAKARENNISKNEDGTFSKRSKLGKEIQSTLEKYEPELDEIELEQFKLEYLPQSKWEEIHKYEPKIKALLGAFVVYVVTLFYFSSKLSITNPVQILEIYQGLVYKIFNGELHNISIDNSLIVMVVFSGTLSVVVYYILKFLFISLKSKEKNKIPLVSIDNYDNPTNTVGGEQRFSKMSNPLILMIVTLVVASGVGFVISKINSDVSVESYDELYQAVQTEFKSLTKGTDKPIVSKPKKQLFEITKKRPSASERISNSLKKQGASIDNRNKSSMIRRLYGKEFDSFTPSQQKFIKKQLRTIHQITQEVLLKNGYPEVAVRLGQEGTNVVSFYLHPNGDISNLKLVNSLDYKALDQNTMAVIKDSYKKYPRPKMKTKIIFYVNYSLY
jgi:TonB family protein